MQSRVWVCDRSLAGNAGSNLAVTMDVCVCVCVCLVSVVGCQVEISAPGQSLVQRSRTECGVSEYDRESSVMRRTHQRITRHKNKGGFESKETRNLWITSVRVVCNDAEVQARFLPNKYLLGNCHTNPI